LINPMPAVTLLGDEGNYTGCNEMSKGKGKIVSAVIAMIFTTSMLTACGWAGDTGSIKSGSELAVDCKTDEALAAFDKAQQGGGLAKYLAELERVAILRDAGRTAEADKALEAYLAQPEAQSSDPDEIESSIQKTVEKLREERRKKTGSATCP
jgi:hypothetical protein